MTIEGVDFSTSRPGGAALAAAGKAFVVRYVPYGGYAKGLTATEVADYQEHGLAIGLVFESTATRALAGQAAGAADGRTAAAAAAGLGFPTTTAIYFGVDFDCTDAQLPAIDAYLEGAGMILGADRVGVYGGRRVVAHRRAAGTRWLWQTYAWSGGLVVAGIHLFQYLNGQAIAGSSVDLDRAMQADFGAWPAPLTGAGNVPGEGPDVLSKIKGEDFAASAVVTLFAAADPASSKVGTIAAGTILRSIAEAVGSDAGSWRLSELAGAPAWFRYRNSAGQVGDMKPVVSGGDPATDAELQDYIARKAEPTPAPAPIPTVLAPGLYEVAGP